MLNGSTIRPVGNIHNSDFCQSFRLFKQLTSNNVASKAFSGICSLLISASRSSHSLNLLQRVDQGEAEGVGGGGGQVQGQADQGVKERLHCTFHGPYLQVNGDVERCTNHFLGSIFREPFQRRYCRKGGDLYSIFPGITVLSYPEVHATLQLFPPYTPPHP